MANPTFKAKVGIPVAGGEPVIVEFTFKHRTKDALDEFCKTRTDKSDAESILDMATEWEQDEDFNAENIEVMCQNYIASPIEIYRAYLAELNKAKVKN